MFKTRSHYNKGQKEKSKRKEFESQFNTFKKQFQDGCKCYYAGVPILGITPGYKIVLDETKRKKVAFRPWMPAIEIKK